MTKKDDINVTEKATTYVDNLLEDRHSYDNYPERKWQLETFDAYQMAQAFEDGAKYALENENTNSKNKIDDMKEQENYKTNSQQLFAEVLKKMNETYLKKNHDYGNSFNKSLDEFGEVAAMIRISDKINRLKTLLNKKAEVSDESLDDTIMDCANYLVMWHVYRIQSQRMIANSGVTTSVYNCTVSNDKLP